MSLSNGSNTYLITLSGRNTFRAVEEVLSLLGSLGAYILDIRQAIVLDAISLATVAEFSPTLSEEELTKELLFVCHKNGLHLNFQRITSLDMPHLSLEKGRKKYIITLVGNYLYATHLSTVLGVLHPFGAKIDSIKRLSPIKPLNKKHAEGVCAIELMVEGEDLDISTIRKRFLELSREMNIDMGIQEDTPYRRHRRLIAFDMDSTLIQTEVIDELARLKGVKEEVSLITEMAMRGEIDFKESLRKRVRMLEGLEVSRLKEVAEGLPLTEGAHKLIQNLKVLGYKIAIISGGFTFFGNHLKKKLGIDYVCANRLEIREGRLTGRILGEIIDGEKKAQLLRQIAKKEKISLEQVIAVGDGANDLPMLNLAGLGIAFRAKPVVQEGAKQSLTNMGLDAILYFIGLTETEAVL